MKIVNKIIILFVVLLVFVNIVTYLFNIPFMEPYLRIMDNMELYFIGFLIILSVASSALIDDRAIIMSNLFVTFSLLFLIIAGFNFATGNSIIPSIPSIKSILIPFVEFNVKNNDTLEFLFSISTIGLVFTGLFSIIEQPDIKNSISKKIKFVSKSALYLNIIVFVVGLIVYSLNFDIGILIFNKVFYILTEIIIYSSIIINVANFGFDVQLVPDSEFVHSSFVLPTTNYNINPVKSSSFGGTLKDANVSNNNGVTHIVSNTVVEKDNKVNGVELFGSKPSAVIENKPANYVPPVMNPIPQVVPVNNNITPPPVNVNPPVPTNNEEVKFNDRVIPMISTPIVRENNIGSNNSGSVVGSNNTDYNVNEFFKVQN